MNLFAQLRSCLRPPPTKAMPSSNGTSHHPQPPHSAIGSACRPLQHLRRKRQRWQPALADIGEDSVHDHDRNIISENNNVVTQPHKKPSVALPSHDDLHCITERRKSNPIILLSPFSMF